jgi:hypothetical protein
MAKIIEQQVLITLSTLVKDDVESVKLIDNDFVNNIEVVVQELVDKGIVVEVKEA